MVFISQHIQSALKNCTKQLSQLLLQGGDGCALLGRAVWWEFILCEYGQDRKDLLQPGIRSCGISLTSSSRYFVCIIHSRFHKNHHLCLVLSKLLRENII